MKRWEEFEKEMTEYLKEKLKEYDVSIERYGSKDSTVSDIEIRFNNKDKSFFVEVKMPNSQTSQFVVEPMENKFIYSPRNKYPSNFFSENILKELNNNYEYYMEVKQNAIYVDVPPELAFAWIVSNMENKNVKFIISVDKDNQERVIPIDQFHKFFNVKTTLRRKKSGSSKIAKKYYDDLKKKIDERFSNIKYKLFSKGNKLYIYLPLILSRGESYIDSEVLDGKRYFLSDKGENIYEIKITSRTNHANVIFELSLNGEIKRNDFTIQCLVDYLESENN